MTRDLHGIRRKDWANFECFVAVHGESASGLAWLVSIDGEPANAVFVPKSLTDLGQACGGFERMDRLCQRVLVPIHAVEIPVWLAIEKGFARERQ